MRVYFWIFVILPLFVKGQDNLVPNGNFENYVACPHTISQITLVSPWDSPTINGSPDYYNSCADHWGIDVPGNGAGFQTAHSGNGYAGIFAFSLISDNQREFLQIELTDTIIKGIPYVVGFWLSLADNENYSVSTIGAYLSEEAINDTQINTFDIIPQIMNNPIYPLDDKENWMLITDTFISNVGGERYITIGNFFDDSESDTVFLNSGELNWIYSYYYIDDVSVIAVDTTIGINEREHSWFNVYPNPNNGSFILQLKEPAKAIKEISIYDLQGRKLLEQKADAGEKEISITTNLFSEGVYTLCVRYADGKTSWQKIIFNH